MHPVHTLCLKLPADWAQMWAEIDCSQMVHTWGDCWIPERFGTQVLLAVPHHQVTKVEMRGPEQTWILWLWQKHSVKSKGPSTKQLRDEDAASDTHIRKRGATAFPLANFSARCKSLLTEQLSTSGTVCWGREIQAVEYDSACRVTYSLTQGMRHSTTENKIHTLQARENQMKKAEFVTGAKSFLKKYGVFVARFSRPNGFVNLCGCKATHFFSSPILQGFWECDGDQLQVRREQVQKSWRAVRPQHSIFICRRDIQRVVWLDLVILLWNKH